MTSALAIAALTALVWRPWHRDPQPPWSARLLVNLPTSRVITATTVQPSLASGEVGAVYADPGATLPALRGADGRSAMWVAYPADDSLSASLVLDQFLIPEEVHGARTSLAGLGGSAARISFGPIDGRVYDVTTNGLTRAEALAFAGSIDVNRGEPILRDQTVALGMERVGTYGDYLQTLEVLQFDFYTRQSTATTSVVLAASITGVVTISSLAGRDDDPFVRMMQLILGSTTDTAVHRQPAISANVSDLDTSPRITSLVAWHERGRFIVVAGSGDTKETMTMAESTSELTEAEWVSVAANVDPSPMRPSAFIGYRTNADGSVVHVAASTSNDTGDLQLCTDRQSEVQCTVEPATPLPILTRTTVDYHDVVVAMVDSTEPLAELRIAHTDGSVDVHVLFQPTWAVPGPAVAVFTGGNFESAELLVDGQVVATI